MMMLKMPEGRAAVPHRLSWRLALLLLLRMMRWLPLLRPEQQRLSSQQRQLQWL